jgi:gliding motility-associated-like protein
LANTLFATLQATYALKYKSFLGLVFCFLLQAGSLVANHLMGSDITYHCIAKWKYEVTLTIYRDCNGVGLSSMQPLSVVCKNQTWTKSITLNLVSKRDITGQNLQCGVQSRCVSGQYPYGVEEFTYIGMLDLSSVSCTEFVLSWSLSARNAAITTGAANRKFYTEATLYTNLSACNSSPVFSTPAAALVCVGSDFTFNNGAIDTFDVNDSLSYRFVDPLSDPSQIIPYFPSWSATMPLTFYGYPNADLPIPKGFHLDSITGNLSFRPVAVNEATVIVLEVTEWRKENGAMRIVGITRRDMQIVVINCGSNSPPTIGGESVAVCPNQPVCIKITTDDVNPNDSVKISWNRGIAGATFQSSGGTVQHDTATICWTPTENDVRTTPYIFTITARDNGCPLGGQAVKAFTVYVDSKPTPAFTINDTAQCAKNQQFDFINTSTTNLGTFSSAWSFSDGQTVDAVDAKNIAFGDTGNFWVKLKLTSYYGCQDSVISSVKVYPHPNPNFELKNYYCTNTPAWGLSAATPGGVFSGKNCIDSTYNPTITGVDTIMYKVATHGCQSDTTKYTTVYPYPVLNLGPDTLICKTESVVFDVSYPNSTYLWQDGTTQPQYKVFEAGLYAVTLFNICDTLTDSVNVALCKYSFVPSVFSPNNDGLNDIFIPSFEGVAAMNMKIFDRWGGLIFESENPAIGWDGNFNNGAPVPIGVYLWYIELKFNTLGVIKRQTDKGNITLIR